MGYELVNYRSYSNDLASSDYALFQNLKKCLCGKTLSSNKELIEQRRDYFKDFCFLDFDKKNVETTNFRFAKKKKKFLITNIKINKGEVKLGLDFSGSL